MTQHILTSLTVGEWTAIVGMIITALCSIIIPLAKFFNKKKQQYEQTIQKVKKIEQQVDQMISKIDNMATICDTLNDMQSQISATYQALNIQIDRFEVQQLKHIINDAFLGYDDITHIPDEVLIGASQSCDIYVGKGLNHETGARCKLIYEELERRQRVRAHAQEGDHHA